MRSDSDPMGVADDARRLNTRAASDEASNDRADGRRRAPRRASAGRRRGGPGALALALLLAPSSAFATDGVYELNQTCAEQTGCIDDSGDIGDAPGFPITIEVPGSYVLTSDLVVGDPTKDGLFIATAPVTIDLNGFEIRGPVSCTGFGSSVSCAAGSGRGIRAEARPRITVRNGNVVGFGSDGILVAGRSRIVDVVAERNGGTGIVAGFDAVVTGSRSHRNGGDGIRVGDASTIETSTAASNRFDGLETGIGGLVVKSTARDNGANGVLVADGGLVSRVVAMLNEAAGISAGDGSTLVASNAYDNDGNGLVGAIGVTFDGNTSVRNGQRGIDAGDGCVVRGNSVTLNGGHGIEAGIASLLHGNASVANDAGLLLGDRSAYRENVISNNTSGNVTPSGSGTPVNLGDNECDGIVCP